MNRAIVLAAGKGTRMKSNLPKVLHAISGKPMLYWNVKSLKDAGCKEIYVVVGYEKDLVIKEMKKHFNDLIFVTQKEQLGTAHAVKSAQSKLKNKTGRTIVISGDTPLMKAKTIKSLFKGNSDANIGVMKPKDAKQYGRIINDGDIRIVEFKDATPAQRKIKTVNSGIYVFDNSKLFKALSKIKNNNSQNEFYLTDVMEHLKDIKTTTIDEQEAIGINNLLDLSEGESIMKKSVLEKLTAAGVKFIDANSTYIEADVKIGKGTVIMPGTTITGKSVIGTNCKIGPNAHIRNNSKIGSDCRIGNFVEIKNSTLASNVTAAHLAYIGDAKIGKETNIGAGVIFANYDGKKKHQSTIGANVFIGSNSTLVAPIKLGKGAKVAAGTTVTKDVPANKMAISRVKQENK